MKATSDDIESEPAWQLEITADPQRRTIPWAEFEDEMFGPRGTPEREKMEANVVILRAKQDRAHRLTGWLYYLPPRWVHYADEHMTEYYGLGPLLAQFWGDFVESLMTDGDEISGLHRRLSAALYSACDGVAWRFCDDVYVPTPRDVFDGSALKRMRQTRRNRKIAIAEAKATIEELNLEPRAEDSAN